MNDKLMVMREKYAKIGELCRQYMLELEGYKPSKADLIAWKEDIVAELIDLQEEMDGYER